MKSFAEQIRVLFHGQDISVISLFTAFYMTISTIVIASFEIKKPLPLLDHLYK